MNVAYNMDCMDYLRSLPDNAFDLAVVDPPFGDAGQTAERREQGAHFVGRGRSKRYAEVLLNGVQERERERRQAV